MSLRMKFSIMGVISVIFGVCAPSSKVRAILRDTSKDHQIGISQTTFIIFMFKALLDRILITLIGFLLVWVRYRTEETKKTKKMQFCKCLLHRYCFLIHRGLHVPYLLSNLTILEFMGTRMELINNIVVQKYKNSI